jgi:uncharacterized protein
LARWLQARVQACLSLPLKAALQFPGHDQRHHPQRQSKTGGGSMQRGSDMIWDDMATTELTVSVTSSAELCMAMAMKYCLGHGVEQNKVMAHTWFNIAAIKGSSTAKSYRLELSQEMTSGEIAEAQRQARQLLTLH